MMKLMIGLPALLVCAAPAFADMKAKVTAPWDGKKVPAGEHCTLDGGNGKTPPFEVTGIPDGAVALIVEYNDKSYAPLSSRGGHGSIGYPVKGNSGVFPALPGLTKALPNGAYVVSAARGSGKYASAGYLPPCSGGRGNKYEANVKAINSDGKVLAKTKMKLGRY